MIPNMYQTSNSNINNEMSFRSNIGLNEGKKYDLDQSNLSEELYEVEKIIDKKINSDKKIFYLIKWVGFDESQMTWEPLINLTSLIEKIEEYERQQAQKFLNIPSFSNFALEDFEKEIENQKFYDKNFVNQYANYINSNKELNLTEIYTKSLNEGENLSISNSQHPTNFNSIDNINTYEPTKIIYDDQNGNIKNYNTYFSNFDSEVKNHSKPQRATKKTFFPNTNYRKTRSSLLNKLEYENDPENLEKLFEKLNHKNYKRTIKNNHKNKKINDLNSEISKSTFSKFDDENKTCDTKTSKNSNNFINLESLNNLKNKTIEIDYTKVDLNLDIPEKILLAKVLDSKLYFWIKWEMRPDGYEPNESLVPHKIIRSLFAEKLLDFYEDRLNLGQDKLSLLKNGIIGSPTTEDRSENSNKNFIRQSEILNINIIHDENLLTQNENLEILNNSDLRIMSDIINQDSANFLNNLDCYDIYFDNSNLIIPS